MEEFLIKRLKLSSACSERLRRKQKHFEGLKAHSHVGVHSLLGGQKRDNGRNLYQTNASGSHLAQRLELGLHDELVFTELAAAGVGALDPLLQTGLVDKAQASRAVAWRDQGTLVPFTVTNPARAEGQNQCWEE